MKQIRMLKSDDRLGFKKGEIYTVEPYWLDPCKLSACKRVPDGKEAGFNVYKECCCEEWEFVVPKERKSNR